MTMPRELVMVRHGQSEANVVQKKLIAGLPHEVVDQVYERPDWEQRLTPAGVEQARHAGDWIRQHIGRVAEFDVVYCSPFIRTRETAALLAGDEEGVSITPEDRIIERDWGLYGLLSKEDQERIYPGTYHNKKKNPLYARLDGGESIMDVYARIRDMDATLHREYSEGRVLMVTHGDYMNARRYAIERMLPEDWTAIDQDRSFDFHNCSILQYSRVNPQDPTDIRDKLHWRRYTRTDDPETSPYGGEWVELEKPRRHTPAEMLARVATHERLIPDDAYA